MSLIGFEKSYWDLDIFSYNFQSVKNFSGTLRKLSQINSLLNQTEIEHHDYINLIKSPFLLNQCFESEEEKKNKKPYVLATSNSD